MAKDFVKDGSIAKVVEEIGTGEASFTQNNINDLMDADAERRLYCGRDQNRTTRRN